jgi:hypothetical protein
MYIITLYSINEIHIFFLKHGSPVRVAVVVFSIELFPFHEDIVYIIIRDVSVYLSVTLLKNYIGIN